MVRMLWRQQNFWFNVLLWVVLVLALAVVYVTYDTRVKFNQLENLRREQSQLQVVRGQFLLEESTWAAYGRVEKLGSREVVHAGS